MLLIGAGGHAKELVSVVIEDVQPQSIILYDDVTLHPPRLLFNKFPIIRTEQDAMRVLESDPRFALALGNPANRRAMADRFIALGGQLVSVISKSATIGTLDVSLGEGLNIMPRAVITESVSIGKGSLVHVHASVHHDCSIGSFCEILPGSHILGHVSIGDLTSIGCGAVVLPRVRIGKNVIVGAGAIVTRDVPDGVTVKGIPARSSS